MVHLRYLQDDVSHVTWFNGGLMVDLD